jgi:mannose-6-phosphate isomerase-like protein (cupin superfamily)
MDIKNIKRVEKPWGYELWWAHTDKYVGKILHINKGESLSYQYHEVKDESLYLYSGKMLLDYHEEGGEKEAITFTPGSSIRIRPYTKHRMTALEECEIFEVSTPEIDDIVRIEDRYGRS